MSTRIEHFNGTNVTVGTIKAYADNGAEATIQVSAGSYHQGKPETTKFYVASGAKKMTQAQMDAYTKAKLKADPANGGDIDTAFKVMQEAGFEVYWDSEIR
jgi:hypothetical protein